ncbi:queuine tRNA-ribosyltransferase accessory subunit 2-like [Ruditapes philippinarum]|uniref:queuine tRNA-ribosyltransferase accessory subunit 2-like n=1 Tax=Ruditapes philippinarum TaxID=129788 RepID=UPI00295AAE91|nr:queuine tRNA-ribosyltransferase accessory subunit 2-like [Ruditapes philippinarum]
MKFSIQCVRSQGARLGRLSEIGQNKDVTVETPMCMLYTRGGSAAHLSRDVLQKLQDVPTVAHMPLCHLAQYEESIEGYKDGMAKFTALSDKIVYTSNTDPAVQVPSGYNEKSGIGLWGKGGKLKLDTNGFVKLQEAVLPDIFQCMSDGDTDKTSTRKRANKAVDRTLNFLDDVLDKINKSKRLGKSVMFGSIVGGYDLKERQRCTRETVARNVEGFALEGFHAMGPNAEDFDLSGPADLISEIIKLLPEEKPRLMQSVWRPDAVLKAIGLGIDMFDSSYPYVVTERGHALVFKYDYKYNPEKTEEQDCSLPTSLSININDQTYVEDFSPLLADCKCYACENFTKAYINHLLNTSELLASTLLMM